MTIIQSTYSSQGILQLCCPYDRCGCVDEISVSLREILLLILEFPAVSVIRKEPGPPSISQLLSLIEVAGGDDLFDKLLE